MTIGLKLVELSVNLVKLTQKVAFVTAQYVAKNAVST